MVKVRFAAAAAVLAMAAMQAPAGAADKPLYGGWGLDTAGMDKSVKPGADFFDYVNGAWDRNTPIPADKSSYGIDYVLSDGAEKNLRSILEADPSQTTGPAAADAVKVHAAYQAFLDETRVNALGAKPIASDLAAIRAARTKTELAALMGQASVGFQSSFFGVYISEDLKTPSRYAVYIGQGGLGLPDRDYYLTPAFAAKKAAYLVYVAQMLTLSGWPDAKANAKAVVDLETEIAKVSWTLAERRDPVKMYNPTTVSDLEKAAPGFAWGAALKAADLGGASRVIVNENTALPRIAALYAKTPLPVLRAWAAFHVADSAAPYLDTRFDAARFAFRGKTLSGQPQQKERWKRAVGLVDGGMGEAVGRVYVARYFPPESKAKIDALVRELIVALGQRIDGLDWMSPATKAKAHEKLAQFTVKVGYPDKWRDYSAVQVREDDLAGDVRAFSRFEWNREVKRLNDPVDRSEWGMTPQTVNAYYNPTQNEIVFPAAILAPPYFDPAADAAVNYGGIGATIGHEMTHGFDDEGRQFDGKGVLTDWWTAEDAAKFKVQGARLNAQYDTYSPFPGVHVKGDQTTGENIADLGGALIALDAYHNSLAGKPAPVIDGLSGDERFFLAYAQSWRDKRREDMVRQQIASDVHSPEKYRVNGVVRNMDPWYASFPQVKAGDPLYVAPAQRVKIW